MADGLPSFDLDSLVKQATGGPDTSYVKPAVEKLRGIEQERQSATAPLLQDMQERYKQDRAEVDQKQRDIEKLDVQPWSKKPPEGNPLEAFGSFASVFAVLASTFTHQPMINALNGAASAMNSIRQQDLAGYNESYRAWKDNSELALKRHEIQYKDYVAAMEKMKTDTAQGNAMLTAMSAQYGDQKSAVLAEAGLYEKLGHLWQSRQNAAIQLLNVIPGLEEKHLTIKAVLELQDARKSGDPQRIAAAQQAVQDIVSTKYGSMKAAQSPERIALDRYMVENPGASAQDIQNFLIRYKSSSQSNKPDRVALDRYMVENPDATAEQIQDFMSRPGREKQERTIEAARERMEGNNSFRLALKDKETEAAWDRLQVSLASKSADRDKQVAAAMSRLEASAGFKDALKDKEIAAQWDRLQENLQAGREKQERTIEAGENRSEAAKRPDRVALDKYMQDHPDATAEDMQNFIRTGKPVTTGSLMTGIIEQRIKEREQGLGRPLTGVEKTAEEAAVKRAGLSGNQIQKLQERVDQFDNSSDRLEQSVQILDRHLGAAGAAGRALRAKEIVTNIFGSNDTDRVQFRRNIEYLQALSHKLLTDATGRPLSSDAKKLDDVIGGLAMGDTTANTLRSLQEIKTLYAKMRGDTLMQLKGDWMPREDRDGGAAPAAGGGSTRDQAILKDKPWLNDPAAP